MKNKQKPDFMTLLKHYISIKGLDIVVKMRNGDCIELFKNRYLEDNMIVMFDNVKRNEVRIPVDKVLSIDLFAA